MTIANRTLLLFLSFCLTAAWPAHAAPTIEQVRKLPPLPEVYDKEPAFEARVAWLKQQLAVAGSEVEQYRLRRALFGEFHDERRHPEAAALCKAHPPLREDVLYRERCLVVSEPAGDALLVQLLALVDDARQIPDLAGAAQVLKTVAWRQSQAGDITGAFQNFEAALATVPADRLDLLGDLMADTATSYIVNGDKSYIQRGIDLLAKARQQLERELNKPDSGANKAVLKENILLSEYNRGIAYALHLGDYENALQHFERMTVEPNPFLEDGLVFAAVSAAELRQFERAKAYLARAAQNNPAAVAVDPAIRQYLDCYRQLVTRHWQAAQTVSACLQLKPETATEVQLDIYKRLSRSDDEAIALAGLRRLKTLFIDKIEPQLRRRGSSAASSAELKRLQRESELKSVVMQQQEALQRERDATNAQRQNLFIALSLLLLMLALLIASQWRAKKKLAEQYERLSVMDSLTQLGNRRYLELHIDRELSQLQRLRRSKPEATLGIYLFDIDHFKSINDRFGHAAGDEVLVTLSQRIQAATRQTDLLVRWGGEEFLLVTRLDEPSRCQQVAERILHAVNATPFAIQGQEPLAVSCTIGAVRYPFASGADAASATSWASLVSLADLALYHGKATGRNRWVIVDNERIGSAQELEQVLSMPLQQAVEAGLVTISTP